MESSGYLACGVIRSRIHDQMLECHTLLARHTLQALGNEMPIIQAGRNDGKIAHEIGYFFKVRFSIFSMISGTGNVPKSHP